jgi:3-phenylpropionate/cinnamic acid dioxygenase small subunit
MGFCALPCAHDSLGDVGKRRKTLAFLTSAWAQEARLAAQEVKVYWSFMVYRSRAETEQDFYVGARRDVLRRLSGSWKIA